MKKFTMIMAAAAAVVLSSCGGSNSPKAQLENDVDSACYAMGVAQSAQFKQYAFSEQGLGVDSIYENAVLQGIIDGYGLGASDKEKAYFAGVALGQNLANSVERGLKYEMFGPNDSVSTVNLNDFLAGFIDAVRGDNTKISKEGIDQFVQMKMAEVKAKAMENQYGEYKKQNIDFMAKMAKEPGVKTLSDGVCYKVETEGTGEIPTAIDRVKVHYEGKTIDGNVFDSSYKRGEPIELACNQVIKGWTVALTHMPVGSKWTIYIPYEAAYGEQEAGPIKPFSALTFTVELLEIVKDNAKPALGL